MPTNGLQLWNDLEQRLGWPVPARARKFLRDTGLVAAWRLDRHRVLVNIETILRCMERAGLIGRRETLSFDDQEGLAFDEQDSPLLAPPSGKRDERWALWRDLRRRSGDPDDDWRHLRLALVVDATNPALPSTRIELSFDSRLSQSALIGEIRRLWPRLRTARWVRETRVLEARAEALLRFVCIENQPDTPWREMMQRWNEKYPDWRHKSVRDFRSRFLRYEKQLTGRAYGLEWFYSTAARVSLDSLGDMTIGDLEDAEDRGEMTPEMRAAVRGLAPTVAQAGYIGAQRKAGPQIGEVRRDDPEEGNC